MVTLEWHMFDRLTAARSNFRSTPCVYIQTDAARYPLRVAKAAEGLEARYRGGTGYAIDAALHGSGNLVFVAAVPKDLCEAIESELIWQGRRGLPSNNNGKRRAPPRRLPVVHAGVAPNFDGFETQGSESVRETAGSWR
jgi:hypothetical protein